MSLHEALQVIQEAAGYWTEYLADNDRNAETEAIDAANDVIDKFTALF